MRAAQRQLVLGIDEAGYGPNIGPLVISCSVWIVTDFPTTSIDTRPAAESMLERLSPSFRPKPAQAKLAYIPLGDSKALYTSGGSLDGLTLGVRYWLRHMGLEIDCFSGILECLAPTCIAAISEFPWYQLQNDESVATETFLSLDAAIPDSLRLTASQSCDEAGLQFLGLSATVIDEKRFNRDVERLGNKANLLSQVSLRLAADCLQQHAHRHLDAFDSIQVYCDKHGGRNRYQALLMHSMPELWFDVIAECAVRSDYRTDWQGRELRWSFLAKGDRLLASALASMTAKWLREGLMSRLNQFWLTHIPNLKPTAGYPADAKRFREAIQPVADKLMYPLSDWWRFR